MNIEKLSKLNSDKNEMNQYRKKSTFLYPNENY